MHGTTARRDFLRQTAFAVVAAGTGTLSAAEERPAGGKGPPVIDTHVHLWDLKQFTLPWLKPDAPFARDFKVDDFRKATEGVNLTRGVYMEVDVAPDQKQAEADWVRELCAKGGTPIVAAVVGGLPASEGFKKYVTPFKGDPYIKGVRQVLHVDTTPADFFLGEKFVASLRLLGELGLSFDLCMRHADLPAATKLIGMCPDTRFVLDHCGNPDLKAKDLSAWKRDMEALAKQPNVVGKVSGILFTAKKGWTAEDLAPVVNHTLDVFGPDRVLYAADWPVCTVGGTWKQWYEAVTEIVRGRKEEERRKLFHDNAVKFYGLKA